MHLVWIWKCNKSTTIFLSCNDHISSETFNCWNILPLFHFTDRILVAGSGRWMSKVSGLEYHQTPDKSKKISNMRKSSFYSLYNNVLSYVVILIYIKMILYNIIYPRIFQLNYFFFFWSMRNANCPRQRHKIFDNRAMQFFGNQDIT